MNNGANVGYYADCSYPFAPTSSSYKLKDHSNVGVKGRHVYMIEGSSCGLGKSFTGKHFQEESFANLANFREIS